MRITIKDAIKELERELSMRNRYYPKWIRDKNKPWMTEKVATRQRDRIRSAFYFLDAKMKQRSVKYEPDLDSWIQELNRELEQRERNYPAWILNGSLNRAQANRQYLRLQKAKDLLQEYKDGKDPVKEQDPQINLFNP